MITGYMLDTNVFNRIVESKLSIDEFLPSNSKVYVTHIQLDELKDASNDNGKRDQLLKVVEIIGPENVTASLAVWGDSYFGAAEWGSDSTHDLYEKILNLIPHKKKKPFNASRDARLAVTAIRKDMKLITFDENLYLAMKNCGYEKNVDYRETKNDQN